MKKIILVYGEDSASNAALEEIKKIHWTFQNEFSQKNLKLLILKDDERKKLELEIDIEFFPTLILQKEEDILLELGYHLDNQFNYLDIVTSFFNIENYKIFYGWIFNSETLSWESPIIKPLGHETKWDNYEERWLTPSEIIIKNQKNKPFDSWIWDTKTKSWQPPIKRPKDNNLYTWGKDDSWKLSRSYILQEGE